MQMCCSRAYYVIMMLGTAHAAALMVTGNWQRGADTNAVSSLPSSLPHPLPAYCIVATQLRTLTTALI